MRRILNIIDVSIYMHAGSKGKHSKDLKWYGLPKGGIDKLLRELSLMEQDMQAVILAFDSRTDRRQFLEEYKQNRVADKDVLYQGTKMYEMLKRAGYKCLKEDGYEADDLICKAVKDNYDKFIKIKIYTADRDLAHLIDKKDKVSIVSPISTSTDINLQNYKWIIDSDRVVEYNTVLPYKVFFGDKSDNIEPVSFKTKGWNPESAMKLFVEECMAKFKNDEMLSHPGVMKWWLQLRLQDKKLSVEEIKDLLDRVKVMYPKVPDLDCSLTEIRLDMNVISEICTMFNLKEVAKHWGIKIPPMTEAIKKAMFEEKRLYETGLQAIDNNVGMDVDIFSEDVYDKTNVKSF